MVTKRPPLDNRHYRAAVLLVQGEKSSKVAEAIGVSQRTINDWRQREDFKRMVFGLQSGLKNIGESMLRGYLIDAVEKIGSCLDDDCDDAVALRAAFGVLDRVGLPATERRETTGAKGGPQEMRITFDGASDADLEAATEEE